MARPPETRPPMNRRAFKGRSRAVADDQTSVMRLRDYSATVARC